MTTIAISYRREDAMDITGRIFDRLTMRYGRDSVFRNIDSMDPGFDFRDKIKKYLDACDILLVIVGPRWLGETGGGTSRIKQETDFVRHEVETGLKKGIAVIPVLVGHANMPSSEDLPDSLKDFVFRQAVMVDSGRDFDHRISNLIRAMDHILDGAGAQKSLTSVQPAPSAPAPRAEPVATVASAIASPPRPQASASTAAINPGDRALRAGWISRARIVRAIGPMVALQSFIRLLWIGYWVQKDGLPGYFFYNDINIAEFVILVWGAAALSYVTMKASRWAWIPGLALCVYGILNDVYSCTTAPLSLDRPFWLLTNVFYFVTFGIGLVAYGAFRNRTSDPGPAAKP